MSATARPLAPPATATPRTRGAIALIALLLSHTALAQLSSSNRRLFLRNSTDGLPFAVLGRLVHGVPVFGEAMAVGDFNGDGYDDLAAGAPSVNTSGVADSGAMVVRYGTPAGISLTGRQIWHKGNPGIPGDLGVGEEFGAGLAAGDFNDDGIDDLVVAILQQILGTTPRGGVLVIYGRRAPPPSLPTAIFANGFE